MSVTNVGIITGVKNWAQKYLSSKDENKPASTVATSPKPVAQAEDSSVLASIKSWLTTPLPSLAACSEDTSPSDPFEDGGVQMDPTDPSDDGEETESGATINPDGTVTLPDDGTLGDDIFFGEIGNEGDNYYFDPFVNTGQIVLESGLIETVMGDDDKEVVIATNSSWLEFYPADNASTTEIYEGAFPGLIDFRTLTQDDIDHNIVGCTNDPELVEETYDYFDTGYEHYVNCPFDDGNRLPLYIQSYKLEFFHKVGDEFIPAGSIEDIMTDEAELYLYDVGLAPDSENITPLGIIGGMYDEDGAPVFVHPDLNPNRISIPNEYLAEDDTYMKLFLTLTVDARNAITTEYAYKTYLEAWIQNAQEE